MPVGSGGGGLWAERGFRRQYGQLTEASFYLAPRLAVKVTGVGSKHVVLCGSDAGGLILTLIRRAVLVVARSKACLQTAALCLFRDVGSHFVVLAEQTCCL